MDTTNVETLIKLATYFRVALNDEIKLPENGVTIPNLVQVDGTNMVKISSKSSYYRNLLIKTENSLEEALYELTSNVQPARTTKPKDKVLVDAQTSVGVKATEEKKKSDDKVSDLMPKKENNEKLPTYGSLFALPKIKEEDKESLISEWKEAKGTTARAKLYVRVRDLLNNQKLSISEIRADLAKFAQKITKATEADNEVAFVASLTKEGIDFKIGVGPDTLISGEELLNGKTLYQTEGDFNLLLLTGKNLVDNVSPQDYVKLRAMWLRTTGRELNALDELTKFYSDEKKGIIWTSEQARTFLNGLFKVNKFDLLQRLIENIFVYKEEEKGSYKAGVKQAKNLIRAYSRYSATEEVKDKKGKITKKSSVRSWPDHKINNFLDKIALILIEQKKLKAPEKVVGKKKEATPLSIHKVTFNKNEKGKFDGIVVVNDKPVKVSNYETLSELKSACEIIVKSSSTTPYNIEYTDTTVKKEEEEKADGTASTKSVEKKTVPTDKVAVQTNTGSNEAGKGKNAEKKVILTKQNKAVTAPNSTEKYQKSEKEKEALKQAKKAFKKEIKSPTNNVNEKTTTKPQYMAIIVKETDNTFTCTLKGFDEVIQTTGSKTMEDAQVDFHDALIKYSEKIKLENDRNRKSHKKGKMLHMKPDFSSGELTFQMQRQKTGS